MWWIKVTLRSGESKFIGEFGYNPEYPNSTGERITFWRKDLAGIINFLSTVKDVVAVEFIVLG